MFEVSLRVEVIQLNGYTEDGERIFRDVHYLIARNEEGYQFQSERSFQGWDIRQVREDYARYEEQVAQVFAFTSPTLADMRQSKEFFEIRPCYGSLAYQRGGCEQELIDLERKEEMEVPI